MTETLQTTTARLVQSERVAAWQEIAKRLAHELKNPLTPIQMSLETLAAAQATGSPRFEALFTESVGPVLEEVERLKRTIDSFSQFARMPKPRRAPLDLSAHLRELLPLHASTRADIQVSSEIEPGLRVDGDRDQLTQVLVNLLRNAEDAMPHGGQLWVRARSRNGKVIVEVEDTGPGLTQETRAQLFTPYFTTKQKGTGLGLPISARIAQEHGGALEASGKPPPGALFRLELPLKQE